MNDRYATQRVPYARPAGVVHPVEIYDGADLAATCPRPGAYDAMKLPSRLNGRTTTPPAPAQTIVPPRAVTSRARISVSEATDQPQATDEGFHTPPELAPIVGKQGYRPRAGSLAESVIHDLRTMPAGVAYTRDEIEAIFSVSRLSVATCLERCLEAGLLVRVRKGRCFAYALPSSPSAHSHEPHALTNAA